MNEKLYAIKNDYGEWADTNYDFGSGAWASPDKSRREEDVRRYGGHVVTLIEEPEKVVLTKEQAGIVEYARDMEFPANYISGHASSSDEEKLIMEAYVSGYTVKKEPVSLVYVPGTNKDFVYCKRGKWSKKGANPETPVTPQPIATWRACEDKDVSLFEFTDAEITKFGLQDCKKEEVK